MISNISLRLGFNYDVQKETILRVYQLCRYNKAWDDVKISPWCAAFTREDLKRLEYAEDLETYYKYGYGSALNKDVGCTHVKDMMSFFDNFVGKEEIPQQQPRAMIQLSEAGALLMTLAALGAHQDTAPLTGDNYHSAGVQSSKWTASKMAPFNGNLAAVLYK
uniref:Multiple inositol polyphosphate phosphatase 1 n=1 Tax=Heliothis virescens TaxID=7102 RepID=A0A2A4J0D4_HELVI